MSRRLGSAMRLFMTGWIRIYTIFNFSFLHSMFLNSQLFLGYRSYLVISRLRTYLSDWSLVFDPINLSNMHSNQSLWLLKSSQLAHSHRKIMSPASIFILFSLRYPYLSIPYSQVSQNLHLSSSFCDIKATVRLSI